mmetsp:Transcript_279/g.511  ORF Transcript_279/g.511 Transcript_279/m.511 type:complete len:94 (-) Transcript_279:1026-1307(-)
MTLTLSAEHAIHCGICKLSFATAHNLTTAKVTITISHSTHHIRTSAFITSNFTGSIKMSLQFTINPILQLLLVRGMAVLLVLLVLLIVVVMSP